MKITGIEEAVENYEACVNTGLHSAIMLNRATGSVWASERVSENDWIEYSDDAIADITADAIEARNAYWRRGEEAPGLVDIIPEIASAAINAYRPLYS